MIGALLGASASVAARQPKPRFEVASVTPAKSLKPSRAPVPRVQPGGRFSAGLATVESLVSFAYDLKPYRIAGGPDWVRRDRFEVSAKAETDAPADQIRLMVQSLLEDRFNLVTHIEQREMPLQALVRTRSDGSVGPGLVRIDGCSPEVVNELRRTFPGKYPAPIGGGVTSSCSSMGLTGLADFLSVGRDVPVIDATGLKGSFYYTIRSQFTLVTALFGVYNNDPNLPALSTALQEQLGLKLEPRRGPVDVLVIDSVQHPAEN